MDKGITIWFLGLPCSGKTTLADKLKSNYKDAVRLDGDIVRKGVCANLGFSAEDRYENIRRCAEFSQLLNDQGIDVICSFVTPLSVYQKLIRYIIKNVTLIYVSTPPEVCEGRDVKGMWARARKGQIIGFTGYDGEFETPEADIIVDGSDNIEVCYKNILRYLKLVEKDRQT